MSRSSLPTLLLGVAFVALATPSFAQKVSAAADSVASDDDAGGEIVVTARRRAENLQEVPIAVTAYSGEVLENQGALDITDIGDTTPNVTLEVSRGTNSTLSAFIRGVGQQDPVAGFEQGVGIYLDDVYLNRPQAAVLDIYDVERIEVLRGPQGTLYGRNTIGGAIKYVTRRLSDEPELRLRANFGTYKQADGIVSATTPLGDGLVRLGGSLARLTRSGFGDNFTTGQENYNKDIWAGRFSAEINNESNVFVRLSADYSKDESNARGGHRLIPSFFTNAPVLGDVYDTRGGLNTPEQDVEAYGFALNGEFEINDLVTFRSITSYRKDESSTPIDFDALVTPDLDVAGLYKNSQTSQEIQFLFSDGPFNALLGGYFLDAHAETPFDVRLFSTVPGLSAFTNATVDTETFAVFADGTYDFTDRLSLSLGARYTRDEREASVLRQNFVGGGSRLFGGAGTPFGAASTNFRGKRDFKKFTPRASLTYKPNDDNTVYVSYSQGFKGGGFDPRGVGVNAPDLNANGVREQSEVASFLSFAPETVDSYEIGYKARLLDRINVAVAAFRADYSDVQIPGSSGCTVGGVQTFCGVVTNAGKARFQGFELEANTRLGEGLMSPGDRLNLAASLGYIDAKFREYITNIAGMGPTDVADFREVQNTPKVTASGTLGYETPVGPGTLSASSTLSYRSKTFQFEIPNPFIDQKAYALLDASLVFRSDSDVWSLGLHAKNLLDKQYKTSGYTFLGINPVTGALLRNAQGNFISALGREGVLTAFYGNPRQVFLSLGYKF